MRHRGTVEQRFERALENAERFFMKTGKVHQAVLAIARRLDQANIPYAIAGAMALGAHGYERVTVGVDVLLTREGLARGGSLSHSHSADARRAEARVRHDRAPSAQGSRRRSRARSRREAAGGTRREPGSVRSGEVHGAVARGAD